MILLLLVLISFPIIFSIFSSLIFSRIFSSNVVRNFNEGISNRMFIHFLRETISRFAFGVTLILLHFLATDLHFTGILSVIFINFFDVSKLNFLKF